ncbi:MAG: hypothetical protein IJ721_01200 [Bacteroidales bacterium]|nr:hypothetical protein [Bacteroidales bacterium]
MRRFLYLVAACLALVGAASSCDVDTDLSVDARADLLYANGDVIHIDPVRYEGFHHNTFSDNDLEYIFTDLTRHVSPDFQTAQLTLDVYDAISGEFLRTEAYGVVYDTRGHLNFADLSRPY